MRENTYFEKNLSGLNCTELIEPEINHQASEYFVENYNTIMSQARKMNGVDPDKVEDLVHDVMISLLNSENAGEGYSMDHSRQGSLITVADFVYGRLKAYSKNRKYSIDGCDRHISTKRVGNETVTVVDFDIAFASVSDGTDTDDMDSMQRAFANAACYDDEIELIEESLTLRKDIETCLEMDERCCMSFLALFRNIDMFVDNFDNSIFDRLKAAIREDKEFGEALMNVLSTASKHRGMFDTAVEEVAKARAIA